MDLKEKISFFILGIWNGFVDVDSSLLHEYAREALKNILEATRSYLRTTERLGKGNSVKHALNTAWRKNRGESMSGAEKGE